MMPTPIRVRRKTGWILGLCLSWIAGAMPAWAGEPRQAHAADLDYLVFETAGARSDQPLPLIVALHYSNAEPAIWIPALAALKVPARVVLPRGPYARSEGRSWFPSGYGDLSDTAQAPLTEASARQVSAFVHAVRQAHPTQGRTILTGVSYGGDLSLLLALRQPENIQAAYPVAARFAQAWWPRQRDCATTCPVIHALHGDADTTVPMPPTRAGIGHLVALGYPAQLTVYPGVRHDFSPDMQRDLRALVEARLQAPP